ncbi:MAG: hypothetical protein NVS3B12_00710 [Acidimicrobiales bacterium]
MRSNLSRSELARHATGRRLVPCLALVGLICAACVQQKDPRVRVNSLQADIVFGLKPKRATIDAPAPGQPTAPQLSPTSGPRSVLDVAQQVAADVPGSPVPLPGLLTSLSSEKCPSAALDAFPDQTAPLAVTTMPAAGLYSWQIFSRRSVGISITEQSGSERRLIRRVTSIPKISTDNSTSLDFTFQAIEPFDAKGSVLQLTYQVRTSNRGQSYTQPQNGTNQAVYAASPDAGLSLVAEDVIPPGGGTLPLFHPSAPLLLLPLPIQAGGKFNSVASDPADGRVVAISGTVLKRARVDACGTIIDGWEVDGTERVTARKAASGSSNGAAANNPDSDTQFANIYATQLGAMPIDEHTLQAAPSGSTTIDDFIGQQTPGALPAGTA